VRVRGRARVRVVHDQLLRAEHQPDLHGIPAGLDTTFHHVIIVHQRAVQLMTAGMMGHVTKLIPGSDNPTYRRDKHSSYEQFAAQQDIATVARGCTS
jgi:hypothetical protein